MKKFVNAEISEIELSATAMGPTEPDVVDEAKYAIVDDEGNVLGYKETYGVPNKLS